MPDYEYLITAIDRASGKILAVASNYDCDKATLSVNLQLIELGFSIYNTDDAN